MPNHAPNGGVADTNAVLSASADSIPPSPGTATEKSRSQDAKDSAKEAARKAGKQARKTAREQQKAEREKEKAARAEAKAADKQRKKANAKTEAAVAKKAEMAEQARIAEAEADADKPSRPTKKSRKLRFEGAMDREEVATYLESITKGLRNGSIHFRQGENAVELTPNDRVSLSVKVATKGDAQRLAFEVEWDDQTSPELSIVTD